MADYRYNFDHHDREWCGPSMNQVIDVIFDEESSGDETLIIDRAEVKNFCKIDIDEDDVLLDEIQLAAIGICEGLTNIGFKERSITAILNNGNGGSYLPYGPVSTVTDSSGLIVEGVKWKQVMEPRHHRLAVQYIGGYSILPYKLKLGLLQCIYFLYDERKRRDDPYPPVYIETLKPFSRK